MKENNEQLRSAEEMTLQECKEKIAKGRNWESYRTFYLMAGFPEIIQVNDEAAELYASQFKSHSPIEQKTDYKVERQRFIDDYTNNRERENMRDSLGRIFDMWIIPLACRIKELESQSLPIEGGEREQTLIKENVELRKHLLEITEWFDLGCYVDDKAHLMIIKAQKFLNPEKWLATRKGSTSGE